MANEKYLTRPKTKPAETLKGKLNKWDNGYAEFIPQGQKPSNRSLLKKVGSNSFYKNEGEKESSYSLHLNVDGASEDPVIADIIFERKQKNQISPKTQNRELWKILHAAKLYRGIEGNFNTALRRRQQR